MKFMRYKVLMHNAVKLFFLLKKQFAICVFVLICLPVAKTQNLVADSSFEANSKIPLLLSSLGLNSSWSAPTWGTTDLFCECGKKLKETSEAQVPHNPFGTQKANTGKCYAGLYAFSHGDYREYLFTQLNAPLRGGIKYELSMYVSLADYSRVAVDQLGACFLRSKFTYTNSDVIRSFNPVYAKISEDIGTDTVNWHQIIFEYNALGGEQYLLIGSFDVNDLDITNVKAPKGVRTKINQRTERDAYYYIDDVSIHEVPPPIVARFDYTVAPIQDTLRPTVVTESTIVGKETEQSAQEVVLDKPLILQNVLFESNAAVLLPASYAELDVVVGHLTKNALLKVEITGHTDNKGNETVNMMLSEKRAKAVADYLVTKSIEPTRITYKGYGSQKPIAANDTEEGRKLNRRVEFMFSR